MNIQILTPQAGQDYPTNWNQFLDWFGTEEACLRYLEKLRWPQGFACPSCGELGDAYRSSRGRLVCRGCAFQSSVTAGTIFDKTRTPLRVWLAGAWYVTNQKHGANALGLQRVLGLGSYQTAWAMLHRFRQAMVRPDRDQLKGLVEIDETYLAITDKRAPLTAKKRKSRTDKVFVAVAATGHANQSLHLWRHRQDFTQVCRERVNYWMDIQYWRVCGASWIPHILIQ